MSSPVFACRRQEQAHKRKGAVGTKNAYEGAFTGELFFAGDVAVGVDTPIVSTISGARIKILSYSVGSLAGGVITFNSKPGGAGVAINRTVSLGANGNFHESDNNGLFQTVAGQALTATVTGNLCTARITYIAAD